jgi:dTDP-glucose pyrophosphorylase
MILLEKIKNIRVEGSLNILNALKQMDESRKRLLLVFKDDVFLGLLSIGDIQRAIISGVSLNSKIVEIMKKDPKVASMNTPIDEIKNEMLQFRMEFMPVVDLNGALHNIYFWEDFFLNKPLPPKKKFSLPVIIMAGGIGTRLKPLTNVLPKPLIPIGEKTILEDIFDRFYMHGCSEFYISVNYKSDFIEYYIRNQKLPYNLNFFKEEKPLGTAGSLSLLKGILNETIFVSNCDILIEQDYSEILDYHRANNNEITIVAALKHFPIAYGTIESGKNGRLLRLIEKPELTFMINSGMYILEPNLLNEIPKNRIFHITDLINKVSKRKGNIGVFPVSQKSWTDIGNWAEYYSYLQRTK